MGAKRLCVRCNRPVELFSKQCKRHGIATRQIAREAGGFEPWKPGSRGAVPLCHDDGTPVTEEERRLHRAIVAGRGRRRRRLVRGLG